MIRAIIGVIVLVAAVLWLPIWIQLALFAAAVIVIPYKYIVLGPAIIGDAIYAPNAQFSLTSHWLLLIVAVMLGIHWFIIKKMRITAFYGLEA